MPLYTAQYLPGATAGNPLFTQRGIKNFTHAKLNDLHYAYSVPMGEVAYDSYRSNIDIFVGATLTNSVIATYATGVDIKPEEQFRPPVGYPPISFVFREAVDKEKMEHFIHRQAKSKVAFEPIFKTSMLVAYSPTDGFIRNLPVFAKDGCTTREDTCSPEAIKWFSFLWKVVNGFLRTNTYPAYMNDDGSDTLCSGVRSRMTVASNDPTVTNKARAMLLSSYGTDKAYGEDAEMEIDAPPHGHTTWSVEDVVLKAKPSPLPVETNLGSPSAVPNLPGILLPYFHGMIVDDRHSLRKIVANRFFRLLGENTSSCKANYSSFRREIESLLSTAHGLVLAHLFFGIEMCLQTQTRMFVMIENETYHGFVLLGARFAIHNAISWHGPLSADDLRTELSELGTHDVAIASLLVSMNAMKMVEKPRVPQPFSVSSVTTPTILADMMSSVVWNKESMVLAAKHIRAIAWPGVKYKTFNLDNIIWAIEHLCDPAKPLEEGLMFYMPPTDFLHTSSRTFRILASFGPSSFSFINAKGEKFKVLAPGAADPADAINEKTKKKNLPHFLINYKPVLVCLSDWEKFVKTREFQLDLKERAQAHRNLIIPGPGRDRLLQSLKENFAKLEVVGAKRKAREEEGEAGPSKKAKAAEVAFSLDFDDE